MMSYCKTLFNLSSDLISVSDLLQDTLLRLPPSPCNRAGLNGPTSVREAGMCSFLQPVMLHTHSQAGPLGTRRSSSQPALQAEVRLLAHGSAQHGHLLPGRACSMPILCECKCLDTCDTIARAILLPGYVMITRCKLLSMFGKYLQSSAIICHIIRPV